jgi:LacI family transcriptional regulator
LFRHGFNMNQDGLKVIDGDPEALPEEVIPRLKTEEIARILQERIERGDYCSREFPPERDLASELGVSRMTARRAVQRLIDDRLLDRGPTGRIEAGRDETGRLRLAFLVPSLASQDVERWRLGIERAVAAANASVRTMLFIHWDDPAITEALDSSFDGLFLYPSCEIIPDRILRRLRTAGKSLVVLGRDLTALGLHSVDLFPPVFVQRLLDHLAEAGHRTVDCFNVQTRDSVIDQRIEQWSLWRATHRIAGRLLGDAIRAYDVPMASAYAQAGQLLDDLKFSAKAVFCTTVPAAVGLIRAMRDRNMTVGVDLSVCVANDEGLARYLCPSLTAIEMPDPVPFLGACLERMASPEQGWMGSLLMQASQWALFVGESTGPLTAERSIQ